MKKETLNLVKQYGTHFFCLQECRLAKIPSSPSYQIYYQHHSAKNKSGGIITGVHKSFASKDISNILTIDNKIHFDYLIINARNEYLDLFLFNFYFNKRQIFLQLKKELNLWFKQFLLKIKPNQKIIICGDFNIKENPFELLIPVLPSHFLTFQRQKKNTLIQSRTDHIMIFPLFEFYPIHTFNNYSDHSLISVQFKLQPTINQQFYFYKFSKANALNLNNLASQKFSDFTCFYNFIRKNLRIAKVVMKIKKTIIPKLNHHIPSTDIFDKLRNEFQNDKFSFFKTLKRITIMNPNKKDGGIFSYYLDDSNELQLGDTAITNCLNQLSSISKKQTFNPSKLPTLVPLTQTEFLELQKKMSTNKAISYDGLSDTFIKKCKNISLFLDIWKNSTIETNQLCCNARIIPLNKAFPDIPNKDQFRPISILSPLFKLLELRFLPKLQKYLIEKLSKQQTGFIPFSSTQINITNLLNLINSYNKKSKMNCIFIDFSNAFNTLNRDKLYKILEAKQILNQEELKFLINLRSNLHYICPLTQEKFYYANGVPQGSPLSPALFDIYLEEFLRELKASVNFEYQSFQYADDIVTLVEHKNTKFYLRQLLQISPRYNLKINKLKSGIFNLHNHSTFNEKLFFNFPIVKSYKYLGIIISNTGKLNTHLLKLSQTIKFLQAKLFWLSQEMNWQQKLQLWHIFILPHNCIAVLQFKHKDFKQLKTSLIKFIDLALKVFVAFQNNYLIKYQLF